MSAADAKLADLGNPFRRVMLQSRALLPGRHPSTARRYELEERPGIAALGRGVLSLYGLLAASTNLEKRTPIMGALLAWVVPENGAVPGQVSRIEVSRQPYDQPTSTQTAILLQSPAMGRIGQRIGIEIGIDTNRRVMEEARVALVDTYTVGDETTEVNTITSVSYDRAALLAIDNGSADGLPFRHMAAGVLPLVTACVDVLEQARTGVPDMQRNYIPPPPRSS